MDQLFQLTLLNFLRLGLNESTLSRRNLFIFSTVGGQIKTEYGLSSDSRRTLRP